MRSRALSGRAARKFCVEHGAPDARYPAMRSPLTSYACIPSATLAPMGSEGPGDIDTRGAEPLGKQRQSSPVPTMRDIARVAGVSQSTVSRVLNDAPTRVPIAAETRERVMVAARELGYRPNPHARSLRGASTMLIGAVVRDFSDPFFATVIEALAVEAMARGYNIVLGHAHGRVDEGIALTSVLETRHTDAIVMLGDMQDQPRLLDDLRHSAVPVVATWQGTSPLEFPTVDVDERAGIIAGLEHLIELGHERIAFVSGRLPGDNWQREDAFTEFMSDAIRRRSGGLRPARRQQPGRGRSRAPGVVRPGRAADGRR